MWNREACGVVKSLEKSIIDDMRAEQKVMLEKSFLILNSNQSLIMWYLLQAKKGSLLKKI